MRCGKIERLLTPYLDGRLDEVARQAVEAHLETCDGCRETHALLGLASQSLAAQGPAEPPEGLAERAARAAFAAESQAPASAWEGLLGALRWPAAATAAASILLAIGLVATSPQRPAPSAGSRDDVVAAAMVHDDSALDDEPSGLGALFDEEE